MSYQQIYGPIRTNYILAVKCGVLNYVLSRRAFKNGPEIFLSLMDPISLDDRRGDQGRARWPRDSVSGMRSGVTRPLFRALSLIINASTVKRANANTTLNT
ncbi:hypothetical protein M407DRAFT_245362 [Tulasnella calospora MUT 4182]|uniref:Uncharacterized protein n=1 Tax=Tulasnella calospora MUT 4182 TaxID=1051891 RepID=A0A0C3Q164_9AGAM|nr:hypothetical protein M407DRAFT_245362 [Tulasnella calospora MUT 4182]